MPVLTAVHLTPAEAARRRRRLRSLAWLGGGVVIGALGCLLALGLAAVWPDPSARDEAAFLSGASSPGVGAAVNIDNGAAWAQDMATAHAWASAHPDLMVAEGDRACRWLDAQPLAPQGDNRPDTFAPEAMEARYTAETTGLEIARVYPEARQHIADWAWFTLCRSSLEAHTGTGGD